MAAAASTTAPIPAASTTVLKPMESAVSGEPMTPTKAEITHEDIDQIEDIIEKISKDKYLLLEQQDLKEEAAEYKEVNV